MVDAGTTPWGACNTCHNATATGYTYAAWATATTGHLSQTAPNCTVCHVSGLKVASGTSSCWDCHGSSATNGSPNGNAFPNYSGSHTKHAAGYKVMACSECHSNGGAGTQNHGSKAAVASTGIAFVNVTSTTKAFHFTATGKGVCSNAYCHSTVQSATGAAAGTFVNPTWGSKLACNGCHGNTAATLTTGTHAGHLNAPYTYACTDCHGTAGGAGNTTIHTNGAVNVDLTNRGGSAVSYTGDTIPGNAAFTGTCNTTTCHGQKSPVWGSTASSQTCTKCHGQANAFNNFSSSVVAPGGLGRDTGGNTASTSPRVGAHQQHLLGSSKMSNPIHCGECHTVHVTVGDPTHLNMTTARIDFGPMAKMNSNYVPNVTRVAGAVNCNNTYCHLGGFRASGAGVSQRGNVTFPTWSFNSSPLDNTTVTGTCTNKCHAMPPSSNGTAGIAGDIHANITTPVTIADIGSKCSSRNDGLAGGGCHPTIKSRNIATGNYTNMTSIFINQGALHVDGIVQGGTCTGCHAATQGNRRSITGQFTSARNSHHYQGPVASLNGTVCYQCHWEANADGSPNSTYHKSGTSGSPVALVVRNTVTTRPAAVSAATLQYYSSGGAAASTRGAIKKIDRQCLGCHDDTNKAIAPFPNDTNTTSAYSWEAMAVAKGGLAGAAQSIAIKFNDIATTPWGKLTGNYTNAKSGQTKAYSAHGNAANNARGWSTLAENAQGAAVANYPNTSGAVNVACYDCHNSHGSESTVPANAVTTSYSSSTGRGRGGILKTTVAGRGGYTVSYRPYTGGNVAQKNVYKTGAGLCFDCHNNATVGLVTSTGFSTPWGYQATFGGTAKIHGYNDNPYFGKTGGAFPKGQTYTYIGTGRPNNMGGHFGASSPLTTATNSNLKIGGLCTPCHDPHGVSPGILAANKQYAVPMLKETFVTSPYKQDAAAVTESHGGGRSVPSYTTAARAGYHIDQNTMQAIVAGAKPATAIKWNFATSANTLQTLTDTQFAGLCLKCHSKTSIGPNAGAAAGAWKSMGRIHNSVKGWAATSGSGNTGNTKHAYTCSKCHSTHNSNLPRLLVTNCLDVTHKGRVTTGGAVNFGPFATSGSRGNGGGQFPGGGARQADGGRSVAPGPWFFGVAGTAPGSQEKCHNTATAGGTTFNAASEQWNTKSIW
jgi:predicted CxxxxCH...CXXCH cytochrome family protein